MCGIPMHFRRTAAKVYNVWLCKYATSVLWFSCLLLWLDVPASKTQLLHTCAFAANFHWLIHSRCWIDELAVSGQLQNAAKLLKFRHFIIYNVYTLRCAISQCTLIPSTKLCYKISHFYPSPEPRIIVYMYFRIIVELEQCNAIGERDLR